jgi:hypothetical protein
MMDANVQETLQMFWKEGVLVYVPVETLMGVACRLDSLD